MLIVVVVVVVVVVLVVVVVVVVVVCSSILLLLLQYVGSGVLSELDSPDATRLAIAGIREASLITTTRNHFDYAYSCTLFHVYFLIHCLYVMSTLISRNIYPSSFAKSYF